MRGTGTLTLTEPRVWVLPLAALVGMAAIALTHSNERVFFWLNELSVLTGDALWANITVLGDTTVALALALLFARRWPQLLWAVVPAALLASGWVHLYKPIFDVTRPPGLLPPDAFHVIGPAHRYHSFPSGHATTAFTLAGVCVLGFGLRAAAILPVAVAVLIAVSRSVVGVHWPLDLLAGACGGWIAAAVGIKLAGRMSFGLHPAMQWLIAAALAGCAVALIIGHQTGYDAAMALQRAIGLIALAGFAGTFLRRPNGSFGGE
jgi:membrane-associated phospholipid phosphatase